MADDDDDREERDEDEDEDEEEVEEKPAPKKAAQKPVKASASAGPAGSLTESELKKIRVLLEESREQQKRYLWILFPIVALLAIQAILQATKL